MLAKAATMAAAISITVLSFLRITPPRRKVYFITIAI